MKKTLVILCAALMALCACSKSETASKSDFDYAEIVINYEAMDNLSDYITITVVSDGQTVLTLNKTSDSYQQKITSVPAAGTLEIKAVLNESYAWNTETLDFNLKMEGYMKSYSKKTGNTISARSLDMIGSMSGTGIKADKTRDYYESKAKLISATHNYSIDADGKITVE